jgi:hypothetical protein
MMLLKQSLGTKRGEIVVRWTQNGVLKVFEEYLIVPNQKLKKICTLYI